ncbi:MAG: hypothetical protein M5F18_00210 [Asgard group archaeon]|nr:hypothetical protein [Asgard group archaeon]
MKYLARAGNFTTGSKNGGRKTIKKKKETIETAKSSKSTHGHEIIIVIIIKHYKIKRDSYWGVNLKEDVSF